MSKKYKPISASTVSAWKDAVDRYSKAREAHISAENDMADIWGELEVMADQFDLTPYEFSARIGVDLSDEG